MRTRSDKVLLCMMTEEVNKTITGIVAEMLVVVSKLKESPISKGDGGKLNTSKQMYEEKATGARSCLLYTSRCV